MLVLDADLWILITKSLKEVRDMYTKSALEHFHIHLS